MNRSLIFLAITVALALPACAGNEGKSSNGSINNEALPSRDAFDSLQRKVAELEEQNIAQEAHIKDLEDDLESVITFLNREMDY